MTEINSAVICALDASMKQALKGLDIDTIEGLISFALENQSVTLFDLFGKTIADHARWLNEQNIIKLAKIVDSI